MHLSNEVWKHSDADNTVFAAILAVAKQYRGCVDAVFVECSSLRLIQSDQHVRWEWWSIRFRPAPRP